MSAATGTKSGAARFGRMNTADIGGLVPAQCNKRYLKKRN